MDPREKNKAYFRTGVKIRLKKLAQLNIGGKTEGKWIRDSKKRAGWIGLDWSVGWGHEQV